VTKADFYELFLKALGRAAENAEGELNRPISRNFKIELHGLGHSGVLFKPDDAVDVIYLGPDQFFRTIDVVVTEVTPTSTTAFVRISGHTPCEFGKTWNPEDLGPFKQLIAMNIRQQA
jgi:hypothetical protein